jgi:polyhydroxyalkanoate synthesis regulator phasin
VTEAEITALLDERKDLRELVQDYGDENQALRARVAALAEQVRNLEREVAALLKAQRGAW